MLAMNARALLMGMDEVTTSGEGGFWIVIGDGQNDPAMR